MVRKWLNVKLLLAITLVSIGLVGCDSEPAPWKVANITGYRPALTFEMMSAETEKTVTAEDYLGKVVVLNFGFTHCPDVCPVSLHQMNAALSRMGDAADKVIVLFVTVDPERDNLTTLKKYTDSFGPQTIGLRGSQDSIDALTTRYKVSIEYEEPDAEGNYEVFHGQGMTVFDQTGQARLMIRPDNSADEIADDLGRLLAGE